MSANRSRTSENFEEYLFESDPKFIARIEALRRQYKREGGSTIEDVRKELGLPRRSRRKRR